MEKAKTKLKFEGNLDEAESRELEIIRDELKLAKEHAGDIEYVNIERKKKLGPKVIHLGKKKTIELGEEKKDEREHHATA